MGWNCTVTLVTGAGVADLAAIGWVATDRTVTFEEATTSSFADVAAWQRGADLVLACGGLELAARTDHLATLGAVHSGLFQSVTDTYAWQVPGDDGGRTWAWSMGEEQLSDGEPHPAETGVARLDEDALLALLTAAGFRHDAELEAASFVVLADA